MPISLKKISLYTLLIAVIACNSNKKDKPEEIKEVDKKVSTSAENLLHNIKLISQKGFAIGHQDATSYGLGWNYRNDTLQIKSDIQTVVNDFPAVFGFDIGHLELGNTHNLDSVSFNHMRTLMLDAYKKGGIITVSWHLDNPTSGGDSWDKTPAVSDIISGGKHHEKYKEWVAQIADFFKSVTVDKEPIPIVFRPFHEMNGGWFWWGEGNCSAEDYKTLWKETVNLLRNEHKLDNLLYAYSPNKLNPNDDYLKYYPGDEYVDMLGIDIYDFDNADDYIKSLKHDLAIVKQIATEKQMPYAFTETGNETLNTPNWFTEVLYPNIKDTGIAWVLFWRNHSDTHHYMTFKEHSSEADFKIFYDLPQTLFLHNTNTIINPQQ